MHEDLLRHIWLKQLFDASRLMTAEKQNVRILNFGVLHRGSGPDFQQAKIEIDGTMYSGDIEFHRTVDDWKRHRHHRDKQYNSVILHVVLSGKAEETISQSGRKIPTLILEPFLLSPLQEIADQLSREEFSSKNKNIPCASRNDALESFVLQQTITAMYRERINEKVQRMYDGLCDSIIRRQRAVNEPQMLYAEMLDPDDIPLPHASIDENLFRQKLPWEQLLYEEIMDGLGYSNNRRPMKKLAEQMPLYQLTALRAGRASELTALELQSALFKTSGLLPEISLLKNQEVKIFIHQLQAAWNNLPKKPAVVPMQKTEWNFSPTRPSNFPTIRIAAAANLCYKLLYGSLFKSLITVCGGSYSAPKIKIEQLCSLFRISDDEFWNYHYSFTEAVQAKHAVLGDSRIHDIIVNTVIPFVCLYAKVFGKRDLAEHSLNIAVELPPLEENTILRRMKKQLAKNKIKITAAYQQQGLIQLYKNYCTAARCNECEIGKRVF